MGIDAAAAAEMPSLYKSLLAMPQGLLFSNNLIQVYIQQDYRGSQARVVVMIKNAPTNPMPLMGLSLGCDLGVIAPAALRTQMQTVQPVLEVGGQVQVQLMVECMQPFSGNPSIELKFSSSGTDYVYPMPIPVIMTKFVEGVPMQGADFGARWGGMTAEGLEVQGVFNGKDAIDVTAMPGLVGNVTGLTVVPDMLAANPNVINAAGTLKTGSPAAGGGGGKIQVGCLMMLEMNPAAQAYRLTVRTQIPSVSNTFFDSVKKLLTE